VLIALGGGVVGDLTGFAAATLLRGLDFVQIPTTLLAQVDSSVGGKTAINSRFGKNLIGAFHQPRLVLADIDTLDTLPAREMRAGYAEMVKYGLIDEPGFFARLERDGPALLAGDKALRAWAVAVSCGAKARIVAADERESGARALLNLGHTFGHALEAETGYGNELLHGEGIAIGLCLAFDLSVALGLCPAADRDRVYAHLQAADLPTSPRSIGQRRWDADRLIGHMMHDKKTRDGRLTFILARGIGRAFIAKDTPIEPVRAVLDGALAA
jgi:3-dehydroquinate synthase